MLQFTVTFNGVMVYIVKQILLFLEDFFSQQKSTFWLNEPFIIMYHIFFVPDGKLDINLNYIFLIY